ncbi:Si-specific NAD(P)(+) transhydrogenase [Pelagicoccus sp. SDUM812002]|uniref:Si-specific NAD(P)(+) transhydrogenase n=1 Tax=Pelagicoccus sp. SDUM812002 TaxID=3041266 RepID=UPI00280FC292|nr:Si-specific NAD(P)(+) transhydrogenase [Pelagicoccus sp. SDUM812002]MDQ8186080.1 Si-specific NAD(P)(+) transhydrogenase [Pelagicoccus sp. SDUM812002]
MTPDETFDLIVIGSGPGGQKAADQAAKAGLKVAIVERERAVGGTCVHLGTIPSKTLREAALTITTLKRNADVFDFKLKDDMEVSTLMKRLDTVLQSYTSFISSHIGASGGKVFLGRASFIDANTVLVTSVKGKKTVLGTKHTVIAAGSRPRTPLEIPVDHEHILDSDSILSMIYLPRSLTVVGAGVIASEYASIFSLLGVKVTMVDRTPRPLMFMEPELTTKFLDNFTRNGGTYIGNVKVKSVEWNGLQVHAELDNGEELTSDKMLVAQGRLANVEPLNLETVNMVLGRNNVISVNENYQTSVPSIYAVGDVIGPPSLASVSMEQGRRAVRHILGKAPHHAIELVPIGIYSVPELSSVGLSEEQAREKYGDNIIIGRAGFEEVARGQIAGIQDGMLKMIADPQGKKLLGVHIVAEGATDLVHVGEMAILNGNDIDIFLENILNFPTLGEAYRIAAIDIATKRAKRQNKRHVPRIQKLIDEAELN